MTRVSKEESGSSSTKLLHEATSERGWWLEGPPGRIGIREYERESQSP